MRIEPRNEVEGVLQRAVELSRVPGSQSRLSAGSGLASGAASLPVEEITGEDINGAMTWPFELGFDTLGDSQALLKVRGETINYRT